MGTETKQKVWNYQFNLVQVTGYTIKGVRRYSVQRGFIFFSGSFIILQIVLKSWWNGSSPNFVENLEESEQFHFSAPLTYAHGLIEISIELTNSWQTMSEMLFKQIVRIQWNMVHSDLLVYFHSRGVWFVKRQRKSFLWPHFNVYWEK